MSDAQIIYKGKAYWTIAKRYHQHRETNPIIRPAAVRDMIALKDVTADKSVAKRIASFINTHQPQPTTHSK